MIPILCAYLRLSWYGAMLRIASLLHSLAMKIGKNAQKRIGLREDSYYKMLIGRGNQWLH